MNRPQLTYSRLNLVSFATENPFANKIHSQTFIVDLVRSGCNSGSSCLKGWAKEHYSRFVKFSICWFLTFFFQFIESYFWCFLPVANSVRESAVEFDGTSFINATNFSKLHLGESVSFSFWIRVAAPCAAMSSQNVFSNFEMSLLLNCSSFPAFFTFSNVWLGGGTFESARNILPRTWHHVTLIQVLFDSIYLEYVTIARGGSFLQLQNCFVL